ncbi:MAG: hypothetical protein GTO14_08335 [Anaerolineales bacterium]|nr:hypothetical protein [Anaerolineales bacterium]
MERNAIQKSIEVRQLGFGVRAFEMWAEGQRIATLDWPKCLSDYAVGVWGGDRWTFDRSGFFRDTVEVYGRSENIYATLHYDWFKDGVLQLQDGRKYRWQKTRYFCDEWTLSDGQGRVVFEIELWLHWFRRMGKIRYGEATLEVRDLAVLSLAGWYLAYMHTEDVAVVVAVTSVI